MTSLAILLMLAITVPLSGSIAAAGFEFRSRDLELADVCTDGLPWTGHAPLSFPARPPRDKHGVPMIIRGGKRHYWPGALAINGMKRIDAYLDHGNRRQLKQALEQAKRLRKMTHRRRNADWLPFTFDYLPAGQRAPWYNAMTQGLALSFYVRLYRVTGDAVHLDAADEVFRSFRRPGPRRDPWVAYVDDNDYLWLEHYPLKKPDHVLNAHLHAIFGIYEYWQLTRSKRAEAVIEGAIETMRKHAPRYRRPGGISYYGLRSRTTHVKYHEIHAWQLRLLARISGEATFKRLAQKLVADLKPKGEVPGRPATSNRTIVGPHCRPETVTAALPTASGSRES